MLVREQLEALAQASAAADPAPAAVQMTERNELLLRLKCLGPAFATTLTNEVFYKDFRNRREVASYFGLTPSPWQSGGIDRDQGISKAGNPRARCAAIELAWLWLRHQPESALTRWFRQPHPQQCQQAQQAHRHRGPGTQADGGALALPHNRPGARGSRCSRLRRRKRFKQRDGVAASAAVSAEWMMTVPPLGQHQQAVS